MVENSAQLSACVLRVDLHCCSKCLMEVKKKLQKVNGVNLVEINEKKGLVIVSGFVDLPTLQMAITKLGKKAEVLAYEKGPIRAKKKLDQFIKHMQKEHTDDGEDGCCCGKEPKKDKKNVAKEQDLEAISMPPPSNYGMGSNVAPPAGFVWRGSRSVGPRFHGPGYQMLPPGYATTMGPHPHMARPYGYPPSIYEPPLQPRLPPPLPPPQPQIPLSNLHAVYSGQKEPPAGNSLHHAFSDDNVQACCIM